MKNDLENETYTQKFINRARGLAKGVKVGGISNALIYFPKCCNPIPGDEIIGYITRGKGVTIHRNNCTNVKFEKMKDRFIDVEWQVTKETLFLVRLKITFEDRKKGFEAKYQQDQEAQFKVRAIRNRFVGEWAAELFKPTNEV